MSNEVTIKVDLADDTKKLLKAVVEGCKTVAGGKAAATTTRKGRAEADESGDDESGDDGEEETDESGDDEFGEDDGDGDGDGEPELEQADVQAALRALASATDKANAMTLLKDTGGVSALSKLKPAKFAAVINAAKKATIAAKKKKK